MWGVVLTKQKLEAESLSTAARPVGSPGKGWEEGRKCPAVSRGRTEGTSGTDEAGGRLTAGRARDLGGWGGVVLSRAGPRAGVRARWNVPVRVHLWAAFLRTSTKLGLLEHLP